MQYSTQDDRQIVSIMLQASVGTILVIDDNQALLQLLQRYLSNHRCQVLTVPNGEKGWELLQTTIPDALIMDVIGIGWLGTAAADPLEPRHARYPGHRMYRIQ